MFVALTLYNTILLNYFYLFALLSHNHLRFILTQENIALLDSATAWQSSTKLGYTDSRGIANKAIDGNTHGDSSNGSFSHTVDGSESPSWHVTWPAAHRISRIKVWYRTDFLKPGTDILRGDKISGFVLTVYLNGHKMWSSVESAVGTSSIEEMYDFDDIPSHIVGDKVEVQLPGPGNEHLSLAEVEVFRYSAVVSATPSNSPSSVSWHSQPLPLYYTLSSSDPSLF